MLAASVALRANSAVCTLIAALAAVVAVERFVAWAWGPESLGTFRALLLVLTVPLPKPVLDEVLIPAEAAEPMLNSCVR